MVYWLLGDPDMTVWGQAGPDHPELGIPMDITMGMRSREGVLVTSAHSFNNQGPIQGGWRFIGEEETLLASYSGLTDYAGNRIEVEEGGMELQEREFFDAISEGRVALTSCSQCMPVMRLIDHIQQSLDANRME
jgi:2-hydroxy-4-carboxymuconate semialdehyde hemiacetal dehydrogenase